ncbi:MAG: hypothetical protein CMLOHMNK_03264 [Steroidobacteraceae bacterium]|nr:hypothetical protein [Steroidobacteraceae bacterium]
MRGALIAALLLLSACGQKGPLYLPEPGGNVVVRPASTPAQPPDDKDGKKPPTTPAPPP